MFSHSIILINDVKIDITKEELPMIQEEIKAKNPCIIVGDRTFPYHQYSTILPKNEADFREKMRLREKGFWKCKRGLIHKVGENCDCKETGEIDPVLLENKLLLDKPKQ